MQLRRALRAIVSALPAMARDLVGIAGAGLISYGAWLAYPPAGFVIGGALMVMAAVLMARAGN